MPRKARKKANSQTYHVMIRGIDRQQIFEDEEDYNTFIKLNAKKFFKEKVS